MKPGQENSFLGSVAAFLCGDRSPYPMSDITMIVPNKRAVLFLKDYVKQEITGSAMLPRFMTMRTFIDILADLPETSDLPELFILYDAYRKVLARKGRKESVREFDNFIFWGDMMISDFDDIDKALASASDVFKNLRDVKEIQADFLNEDQKNVVMRIWGESRLTADIKEFWIHLADTDNEDSMSTKFLYLWEILGDIYSEFKTQLAERKLMSAGGQYRNAVENLRAAGVPKNAKYAFIGFNDPTIAETIIFEHLKRHYSALFFWDTAPLELCKDAINIPEPLARLRELMRNFPAPEGFDCRHSEKPAFEVTAMPSNVAQAKIIAPVLSQWAKDGILNPENAINTAIVLPDPGLLIPALHSLPPEIGAVNISLGLPYRSTTFAELLHSIISMQMRSRRIHGICNFFYEDIVAVLGHPHVRAIASDAADKITAAIENNKLYNVAATDIADLAPKLSPIFTPLTDEDDPKSVASYLDKLLTWLGEELTSLSKEKKSKKPPFELSAIDYFRSELQKIATLVEKHKIGMSDKTFMQLFERIFASRAIAMNGNPLKGLQILGVLETRALDFDNVIILSMNEGIFPKRQYAKTMIPNNLRHGYGLPDFENLERTYAYCFYRLIARAKNVSVFYDARTDGKGNGERSRYIEQIKHLIPGLNVIEHKLSVSSVKSPTRQFIIEKDDNVMRELAELRPGGKFKLSAAALKEYLICPFAFYLKYVRNLRGNDEIVNYFTEADYGTMTHNTIEELFKPLQDQIITAEVYDEWLRPDNDLIESIVREELGKKRKNSSNFADVVALDAEETIAQRTISAIVRKDLEAEKEKYCANGNSFIFRANELKVDTIKMGKPWKINDDLSINFTMAIDRVDQTAPGKLRFIDYKTGEADTSANDIEMIFNRENSKKHGLLQLLTYCEAYLNLVEDSDICIYIHPMKELRKGSGIEDVRINKKEIISYKNDVRDKFKEKLERTVAEIFNPEMPFRQREDDNCEYCNFKSLCGRLAAKSQY